MKMKHTMSLLLPLLILQAVTVSAAEETDVPDNSTIITTVITPKYFAFEHFDLVNEDNTAFLERYNVLESTSGDRRSGGFVALDLDLTVNNGGRDLFVLEHRGYGRHNHRGDAEFNNDVLTIYGNYNHFRSLTGGIDYLYRPDAPELEGGGTGAPPGFASDFNNDAGPLDYSIDRTSYAAGFRIKPPAFSDQAAISVDVDGYRRDGNKFAAFILDSGGISANDRWRGINLAVDEAVNRVGFTLSGSPKQLFEIAYQASVEQFENDAPELLMQQDITDPAGINVPSSTSAFASLYYVPDSELLQHSLRASKNYDNRFLVAAGVGTSLLQQESFSTYETQTNHDKGEIDSRNAYLTASARVGNNLSVEAFVKYADRDNNSSFSDGLIGLTGTGSLVAPRINSIESLDYGISANWRADFLKSRFTVGWNGLDKERDLTYGNTSEGIQPAQSLYGERTLSDEIYVDWSARPARGWKLKLKPSYIQSDETALVTEPEEAFILKTKLSYASPDGWFVNGFYDYKDKQNSSKSFTDGDGSNSYAQELNSVMHSGGLGLILLPHRNVNTYINVFWTQDDISNYLFQSNQVRWNPNVEFTLVDNPKYRVNSNVWDLGADWRISDRTLLNANYSYTRSRGDVASGVLQDSLEAATGTVDSIIDNTLQSLSLGIDYDMSDNARLKLNYFYDYYDDNAYEVLNGGLNTVIVGVALKI
jgi:hypothetical protein